MVPRVTRMMGEDERRPDKSWTAEQQRRRKMIALMSVSMKGVAGLSLIVVWQTVPHTNVTTVTQTLNHKRGTVQSYQGLQCEVLDPCQALNLVSRASQALRFYYAKQRDISRSRQRGRQFSGLVVFGGRNACRDAWK